MNDGAQRGYKKKCFINAHVYNTLHPNIFRIASADAHSKPNEWLFL